MPGPRQRTILEQTGAHIIDTVRPVMHSDEQRRRVLHTELPMSSSSPITTILFVSVPKRTSRLGNRVVASRNHRELAASRLPFLGAMHKKKFSLQR